MLAPSHTADSRMNRQIARLLLCHCSIMYQVRAQYLSQEYHGHTWTCHGVIPEHCAGCHHTGTLHNKHTESASFHANTSALLCDSAAGMLLTGVVIFHCCLHALTCREANKAHTQGFCPTNKFILLSCVYLLSTCPVIHGHNAYEHLWTADMHAHMAGTNHPYSNAASHSLRSCLCL